MIQKIWFTIVWLLVKLGLFFYSKKIKVSGRKNIPKKGAVLFAVNHPNGLVDPLYVTTTNSRQNHFLVRAASFKKPFIKRILESLYLMPIYRIRDGIKQLANNEEIFNKCHNILHKKETLMIFPEGSHNYRRSVRPLSKGFTRIIFGALEKFPDLNITVIPVGITYQHISNYPAKVAINYGKPIIANSIFKENTKAKAINIIKAKVTAQLKTLSVHIPDDENYDTILEKLNNAQVDFTEVKSVNKMILKNEFPSTKKAATNYLKPLYYLLLANSFIPYLIWKKIYAKIDEIEFIDTFRYASSLVTFPLFYVIQSLIVGLIFNKNIGLMYFAISIFAVLFYTKFATVNAKKHKVFIEAGKQV